MTMVELTDEQRDKLIEAVRASGYEGAILSTTIAKQKFVYRALLQRELDLITNELRVNPQATQADITYNVVSRACLWPRLSPAEVAKLGDTLGMGIIPALKAKIDLISGVIVEPLMHFFSDEELVVARVWDAPTEEELQRIKDTVGDAPNVFAAVTSICDYRFVYRSISGKEYRELGPQNEDDEEAGERLLNAAVVWPVKVDWDALPYAISDQLQQKIFLLSGVGVAPSIEDDEELT